MARYIIDQRMKFPKGLQKKFIENVKRNSELTWERLGEVVGVSGQTVRIDWKLERTTIPKSYFEKMAKFCDTNFVNKLSRKVEYLPPCWGQSKGAIKALNSMKVDRIEVINPEVIKNDKFAELVGILLGDGHMHEKGIEITLNRHKEVKYAKYVTKIIKDLFGKYPHVRTKGSAIGIILNSKILVNFLKSVGLEIGPKGNNTNIPSIFFRRKDLLESCVRGLLDTDGGIHKKEKAGKRYIIEFKNFSKPLLEDTRSALEILDFKVSKGGTNSIRIQNQSEVKRYVCEIGSSNSKNESTIDQILHP